MKQILIQVVILCGLSMNGLFAIDVSTSSKKESVGEGVETPSKAINVGGRSGTEKLE